ncbi:D-alanyl-D-alanine carboxypeptidase/D-alanyl-D-alanine-endopeptidase [Fodinibius sp. Rm-B-1B1-1]|uniref:D-alanyl-D-alanine carboxypeptidase/D-alanyl-D-alanine endopeptidase n=1 Tax=Fodinibius alkaliphilus TaxID=3140241 RepID=UPI00315AA67B
MPQRLSTWLSIGVFVALLLLGGSVRGQQIIYSPEVVNTIENSRASDAFWSVIVRDTTGKVLEGYNFEKMVRPASNLKLLTSATILDELGPNYRFRTKMYGLGQQKGDTWHGDIVIRGVGDPSISGRFYREDRFHVFDKFFSALYERGIRKIEGNLIGNDSYFDEHPYPKGWSWEDLSFYYGVEINALSFNNNAVDLTVYANGEVGEKPEIEWFPFDTEYVNFENDQVITPADTEYDEFYRRIPGTNTIMLGSKLPKGYVEKESLSIKEASLFFLDTFKKYLEDGSIELDGRIIVDEKSRNWETEKYKVLHEHVSVSLDSLLGQLNKESDNFYAEMLLKTAAAEHFNTAGSTELGLTLVKDFADSMQMDTTKVEIADASGMSSSTLLKMENISQLLVGMRSHPHFDTYKKSLPVAGKDGSLEHRFRNSPLRENVIGKTGYVSGVRSLSGYMKGISGQPLVFSVVTNNYTQKTSYIDSIHEQILENIYVKY